MPRPPRSSWFPRAALLAALLAAACGEVRTVGSDGGPGDGDAGADAGAPGPVTIEFNDLFSGAGPIEDMTILFYGPDGALVAEEVTDAEGRATAQVVPGSTAVLLIPPLALGGAFQRFTAAVLDLQPGDEIVFVEEPGSGDSVGSMTVEFPAQADATDYYVTTACGSSSAGGALSTTVFFDEDCVQDGQVDIVVQALDNAGVTVGFLRGGGAFVDGGTLTLAGSYATDMIAVSLTEQPASVAEVSVQGAPVADGRAFFGFNSQQLDEDTPVTLAVPFGMNRMIEVFFEPVQAGAGDQEITYHLPESEASLEVPGDDLLPWYSPPVYSTSQRAMHWTSTGGRTPDVLFTALLFVEKGAEEPAIFYVIGPPDRTSLSLPELPEEHASRLPVDPQQLSTALLGVDLGPLDGWDEARQIGFSPLYEDPALQYEAPAWVHRSTSGGF